MRKRTFVTVSATNLELLELPKTNREESPEVAAKAKEVCTAIENAKLALFCTGEVETSTMYDILLLRMELDTLLCRPSTITKPTIH